jgi:hypothetical protein
LTEKIEDNLSEAQRAALDDNEQALQDHSAQDWAPRFANFVEMRPIYAYVEDDDAVIDLRDPTRVYSWKGFCNLTAGSVREIEGARGGVRRQLIAKDWLEDNERNTVKGRPSHPTSPPLPAQLFGNLAV